MDRCSNEVCCWSCLFVRRDSGLNLSTIFDVPSAHDISRFLMLAFSLLSVGPGSTFPFLWSCWVSLSGTASGECELGQMRVCLCVPICCLLLARWRVYGGWSIRYGDRLKQKSRRAGLTCCQSFKSVLLIVLLKANQVCAHGQFS